jgi:hypothetical protein
MATRSFRGSHNIFFGNFFVFILTVSNVVGDRTCVLCYDDDDDDE